MGAIEALVLQAKLMWDGSDAEKGMAAAGESGAKMESKLGKTLGRIGTALATAFTVDKVVQWGKQLVGTAAEVDAEISAFGQIMGDYSDQASAKMQGVADATGMVASRLTPYMTSMTAKFKGLGYGVEDATDMAARGLNVAADASAFWDMSMDESMSHLNSFINGSYEGGEAIGLFANDTQMAAFAVEKGLVKDAKAWSDLDEATKQATRLEYAENMMKQSGATGQAAKESESYANVMANLSEKWRQFQARIGKPLLQKVVIPAVQLLSKGMDKLDEIISYAVDHFDEWKPYILNAATAMGILAAAVAGFKLGSLVSTMATFIKGLTLATVKTKLMAAAQKVLNFVMNLNPIGLIVGAIAALVAAFVIAYKKSETFRNFVDKLWASLKEFLQPAIEAVGNFINDKLVPAFQAVGEWIKTNVVPALQSVGEWITGTVVPALSEMWSWLSEKVLSVIKSVAEWITGTLVPTLKTWGEYISGTIIPALQELGAAIAEKLQPVFQAISDFVTTTVIPAFQNIVNTVQEILTAAAPILEAIKTAFTTTWENIKTAASTVWNVIKTIVSTGLRVIKGIITAVTALIKGDWSGAWEAIKSTVSTAWEGIKTVISTAIEGVKTIISNTIEGIKSVCSSAWEAIKGVASAAWEGIKTHISIAIEGAKTTVSTAVENIKSLLNFSGLTAAVGKVWDNVKKTITDKIESAKKTVSDIIEKIKGFFDFEFKWPTIPMPHFGITPTGWQVGDLLKGVIPTLGVEWYAKAMDNAMVLDKPTIFGAANGQLLGGGEAGNEVVAGEAHLMNLIGQAVAQNNAGLLEVLTKILAAIKAMDAGMYTQIVDALTEGVRFKMDGREFGRLVRSYA